MNLIPHDLKTRKYESGYCNHYLKSGGIVLLYGCDGVSYLSIMVYIHSQNALYRINAGAYDGVPANDYLARADDFELTLGLRVREEERLSTLWVIAHVVYELEY